MQRNRISLAGLIFVVAITACGQPDNVANGPVNAQDATVLETTGRAAGKAASQIDQAYLREIVAEISDDRYEGRGPGSRGDAAARAYLADRMAETGLQPGAADGSWQQAFELVGINAAQPPSWSFEHADASLTLKQREEFIVSSGVQAPETAIDDAELVFVGYGIQAPEFDWDDFKGVDLRGKVLLMMNNDPDWDPELFDGETRLWYGRWDYKYLSAARQGAAGAIIIHTAASAGYPFQVVQTSWSGVQYELPAGDEPRSRVQAWVTEEAAAGLVSLAGLDLNELREAALNRDFVPVPLGVTTSIAMDVELTRAQSANVLGLIQGSDPELRDEVVIYTAHHDHLGIGTPDESGDAIYNGARDNATGVAQVLAIARAFRALPAAPRRSMLFALVGAEEQGLLGSEYYATNPTFAPGKIAANINFDSGNIWGRTHDVTFVGLGKSNIDAIAITHRRPARAGRDAGSVPGQGLLLPFGPVQFCETGCSCDVPESRHRLCRSSAGMGKAAAGAEHQGRLPPALRRVRSELELRRSAGRRSAGFLDRPGDCQRRRHACLDAGR